jgi:hypothetical protein
MLKRPSTDVFSPKRSEISQNGPGLDRQKGVAPGCRGGLAGTRVEKFSVRPSAGRQVP